MSITSDNSLLISLVFVYFKFFARILQPRLTLRLNRGYDMGQFLIQKVLYIFLPQKNKFLQSFLDLSF